MDVIASEKNNNQHGSNQPEAVRSFWQLAGATASKHVVSGGNSEAGRLYPAARFLTVF